MKRSASGLRVTFVGLAMAWAGCGGGAAPPEAPKPPAPERAPVDAGAPREVGETRRLEQATEITSARGVSFRAAAGWTVTETPSKVSVTAPDGALTITVVSIDGDEPEPAIDAAWKVASPGFDRKPINVQRPPPSHGWDGLAVAIYGAGKGPRPVAVAQAFRFGKVEHVVLIEGTEASFDQRAGQVETTVTSLRVPGLESENYAEQPVKILDAERLATFSAFVEEARATLGVPGVAFAVVQGNKVVLDRGLGVETVGGSAKITPATRFLIGSVTKSLTTLMMARLVDEKRFGWDSLAHEVDPNLTFVNDDLTAHVRMQDLVCACTGLPRRDLDLAFGAGKATPESRLREIASLKPTTAIGEAFQYSNDLVSAAGFVAAKTAAPKLAYGPAYDAAMKSRVFDPMGMTKTTFDFAVAKRGPYAKPHGVGPQGLAAFPIDRERWLTSIRPAGGAWSTAGDLARWAATEIEHGTAASGKEVVSEGNVTRRWLPRVSVGADASYGLGILVSRFRGAPVLSHNGGTLGFGSAVYILPKHGVALTIVTNDVARGSMLTRVVFERFFETAFGTVGNAKSELAFRKQEADRMLAEAGNGLTPATDAELAAVLGKYESPRLGAVTLRAENGRVRFVTADWSSLVGVRSGPAGRKLVLTEVPWAGLEMTTSGEPGARKLVIEMPQERYELDETTKGPKG